MEDALKNNPAVTRLMQAFTKLESQAEAAAFLRDVCTLSEINTMAERLEVAKQVDEGIAYRKINQATGVSTATITRVAHWLHHGMGGYRLMLDRLKQ